MKIQLRVRTNDVTEERSNCQLAHDSFMLFDNCTEVKYGKAQAVTQEEFKSNTLQHNAENLYESRNLKNHNLCHPETGERFDDVIFMIRDISAIGSRKSNTKEKDLNPNPFHFNVIEWKDRVTEKRFRLVYDTVVFLMNDDGSTIRKIEG